MQPDDRDALRNLVEGQRQAALGTLEAGAPVVSMVLYAVERRPADDPALLIHVSRLSAHTRNLLANRRASLLVMRPDNGADDPQALPRATFQARASVLTLADAADYAAARAAYLARLPQQEYLFDFPDFLLIRLSLEAARYVGGFARAFSLDDRQVAMALA
jgi:putative heme iron utilization protein